MTTASANALWAGTLARALVLGGVRHVVISPGSRSTPLVLAFDACPEAELHSVLDERAAAFFALGLARVGGRAVALVCTSGSAPAHYLPAVIEANLTRTPLLLLTADRPAELQGCGSPQTVDQVHLFGAHVRAAHHLEAPHPGPDPRWLRSLAARALDAAEGSPPGPVHINLPFRKPLWDPAALEGADVVGQSEPRRPDGGLPLGQHAGVEGFGVARVHRSPAAASAKVVEALRERLRASERGVIVCGPWWPGRGPEHIQPHFEAVIGLALALGWPVLGEPASQLRFGPRAPEVVISAADALLRGPLAGLAPDLILQIGAAPTASSLAGWIERHGEGRLVLIDPDGIWSDPSHRADTLVVAEPARLLAALASNLEPRSTGWLGRWRAADEVALARLNNLPRGGLWEGEVARALVEGLPSGSMLHVASSMPIRDLDSFCPAREAPLAILSSRGANGIDGTIATALGESTAWSGGERALLIGDLAFIHDAGGLLTAPGDLLVVVINNGGGGIFGFLPVARHPSAFVAHFLTPQRVDLGALCEAAGARHARVDALGALREAIEAMKGQSGVRVIEAVVDRSLNMQRHAEAWEAVAEALGERSHSERSHGDGPLGDRPHGGDL